jgi:hypothetical protein
MNRTYVVMAIVAAAVSLPAIGRAQKGDLTHEHAASQDAAVDFGVLQPTVGGALVPIGPPPCLQTGGIGGAADPCAYRNHHLTPEEVTITKGGEVTFQVHGGGHAMAIYEVSTNTTRDELGQFMCAGMDPETIADPTQHPCNGTTPAGVANANAAHNIADGKGNVVIAVAPNVTNAHPDNRVWYTPGRLMSAGGRQFLNGGTIPAGANSDGQLVTYRFQKTGRYLVICMNRSHSMNDWMFGFVNVVGGDGSD